ncbi:MAG TPA: YebC/PmpR family DNA-binding transcriptional regulator, partial [Candidatus Baltobacteraceae bacterium]|nr:YebC/PmpR family DNA-binding transcriptional regulator [Candidatus Baltobacteraceae bacterium]
AGELRFLFSKHGGALGETGGVAWMFDPVGILVVDPAGRSEDAMTEAALIDGVVDLEYGEPTEIHTEPSSLAQVRDSLSKAGMKVSEAYLGVRAKQKTAPPDAELPAVLAFLEALDEHEDAQHVYSNLEVSEAALEALV